MPAQTHTTSRTKLGACMSGEHPELLWHSSRPGQQARARQLCSLCPLLVSCREWALAHWMPVSGADAIVAGMDAADLREATGRRPERRPGAHDRVSLREGRRWKPAPGRTEFGPAATYAGIEARAWNDGG